MITFIDVGEKNYTKPNTYSFNNLSTFNKLEIEGRSLSLKGTRKQTLTILVANPTV